MKDLKTLRGSIDSIDREIVSMYVKRMEVSKAIAAAKVVEGLPIDNPLREGEVLDKVSALAGPEYGEGAKQLFKALFALSKEVQRKEIASSQANAARRQ